MKKMRRNKLITVVTILALTITTVLASSSLIFAASGPEMAIPKKIKTLYYPKQKSTLYTGNCVWVANEGDYEINMEKSSIADPSILKLKEDYGLYAIIKKAGTTTITLVATPKGSKEEQTYKIKVVAEKYVNPLKTFKIGKKNYVKGLNKSEVCIKNTKKISGKLVVKAKKGWKITKIQKTGYNIKPKKIKNGKKVTITGKIPQAVLVTVKNKKTGQVLKVRVGAVKAAG